MNDTITAITGIHVGHYTNLQGRTGCTVALFPEGAVCGVDVRGAAPGTRETDLLRGFNLVEKVNAILLTGGSAFGLAAADGVARFLERKGMGHRAGNHIVPIVPAAVIFDLNQGEPGIRPDAAAGELTCQAASSLPVEEGAVGAGTGATVAKLLGDEFAQQGGVGSAAIELPGGVIVAALVVVNALGDIYDYRDGKQLAGPNMGGQMACSMDLLRQGGGAPQQGNTTIGIVATNATLTREAANRLALLGHDGLAMAIRPVHTQFDGDTLFGVSTCQLPAPDEALLMRIFACAPLAVAEAVARAVS